MKGGDIGMKYVDVNPCCTCYPQSGHKSHDNRQFALPAGNIIVQKWQLLP